MFLDPRLKAEDDNGSKVRGDRTGSLRRFAPLDDEGPLATWNVMGERRKEIASALRALQRRYRHHEGTFAPVVIWLNGIATPLQGSQRRIGR